MIRYLSRLFCHHVIFLAMNVVIVKKYIFFLSFFTNDDQINAYLYGSRDRLRAAMNHVGAGHGVRALQHRRRERPVQPRQRRQLTQTTIRYIQSKWEHSRMKISLDDVLGMRLNVNSIGCFVHKNKNNHSACRYLSDI